jgi:pimeloyl-ACP methyl ester carboxylesterase
MAFVTRNGVRIYYQDVGQGFPVVFSHEFGGDHRSWAGQVGYFARSHRTIAYSNRGYPPSDVPPEADAYSQDELIEDLRALVTELGIETAHFVGLSMGASVVLNLGIRYPQLCASIVAASGGSGTVGRAEFEQSAHRLIGQLRADGITEAAHELAHGPTRLALLRKDPEGFARFHAELLEHDPVGMANTYQNVQLRRPTFYQLEQQLRGLSVPTLVLVGDEDEPVLEPGLFLRRTIPGSGLAVFPRTGHCINLEEPAEFNAQLERFFAAVERGRWVSSG